jgi:hypothetical protein
VRLTENTRHLRGAHRWFPDDFLGSVKAFLNTKPPEKPKRKPARPTGRKSIRKRGK